MWLLVRLTALAAVAVGLAGWRYAVTRPDYRFARGLEAARGGRVDDALWYADRLEATDPPAAGLIRAEGELGRGRPLAALRALRPFQGADAHPRRRDLLALTARCHEGLGDRKEAVAAWGAVLAGRPEDEEAHRRMATLAYDLGQLTTALHHWREVQRIDPRDGRPARMVATVLADTGDPDGAERAYREALRRDLTPDERREVYAELADALLRLRKYADVLALAGEAVAAGTPQTTVWLVARAEANRGLGRPAPARDLAAAALAAAGPADPDLAAALRLRAELHLDDGEPADAIPLLERADGIPPRTYRVPFLLGSAYAQAGRPADADRLLRAADRVQRDLDKVTELTLRAEGRPWDADLRLELAALSEGLGYHDMARQWRRAAAAARQK
jgi:tetratricopeptide (TPR) repeat protein